MPGAYSAPGAYSGAWCLLRCPGASSRTMPAVTAVASTLGVRPRLPRWLTRTLVFLAIFVGLAALWEAYKALGKATDGLIPFTDVQLPVRPDDSAMPHVIDIFAALFRPVRVGPAMPTSSVGCCSERSNHLASCCGRVPHGEHRRVWTRCIVCTLPTAGAGNDAFSLSPRRPCRSSPSPR